MGNDQSKSSLKPKLSKKLKRHKFLSKLNKPKGDKLMDNNTDMKKEKVEDTPEMREQEMLKYKESGNQCFKNNDFEQAIKDYKKAI